jgi:hypothetical protein
MDGDISPGDGIDREQIKADEPGEGDEGEKNKELLEISRVGDALEPDEEGEEEADDEDRYIDQDLVDLHKNDIFVLHIRIVPGGKIPTFH